MLDPTLLRQVRDFPKTVRSLAMSAETEEDQVDLLGWVRQTEKETAAVRRSLGSEAHDGDTGQHWRIVRKRVAKRTFNLSSIIPAFADAWQVTPLQALARLHREGAIVFDWKISKVRNLARDAGVTLTTAQREVSDGDEAHIGEVWQDGYPSYEPIGEPE